MIRRRQFLGWMAGFIPAVAIVRGAHRLSIAELNAAPETLDALGLAILPKELGEAQILRVVAAFRAWLDGYRENAELLHAYGASRLTCSGPTPATRWIAQLDQLGKSFASLSIGERQAIVRSALGGERNVSLGSPERANHVAIGLLSFFYASSAATDLCYEAAIGKNTCRPLARSPERPIGRTPGRLLPTLSTTESGS
jgi:hypothetical protein